MLDNKHKMNRRSFLKSSTVLLGASALYHLSQPIAQAVTTDGANSNLGLITRERPKAATIMVDDFSTGPAKSKCLFSGVWAKMQTGSMLRGRDQDTGRRLTRVTVSSNPHDQPIYLDVGSGFLNWSTGIRTWSKLEVIYGAKKKGNEFVNDPLHVDLSGCDGLQVNYDHLVGRLDAHVTIFTGEGRKKGLIQELPGIQNTFSHVYRFDEDFNPPPGGTWNLADVHVILFLYTIEGDVSISSIELV